MLQASYFIECPSTWVCQISFHARIQAVNFQPEYYTDEAVSPSGKHPKM